MNKSLIVLAVIVLIFILALINACDIGVDEVEEPNQLEGNDEIIAEEPEKPAEELGLPEGFPVYPEAAFISYIEDEDEKYYIYQTTDNPEDIWEFYVKEFEAEGHEDFYYYYDSETSEIQLQRNGYLVTIVADAIDDITEIRISIKEFE